MLEELTGKALNLSFSDWRPGDQRVFISNNEKLFNDLAWTPHIDIQEGVRKLYQWAIENEDFLKKLDII